MQTLRPDDPRELGSYRLLGDNDNKDPGEPWQITISANRLPATHGYEVYALPAV
ncbi:hypothetical protein [Streptomyces tauricus]|uniref:hypothetical protein n=1 Tax=Streptomyces tauricus TaxID=68274 RepID=UPI0022444512|nr:hypothetical protein [Streptomyces tauricus]MCW8097327.1 hypothetical protein [Streptomyces tauricus]